MRKFLAILLLAAVCLFTLGWMATGVALVAYGVGRVSSGSRRQLGH